jgi:polysaccharide pyruvyl transferase WcaK-like protein
MRLIFQLRPRTPNIGNDLIALGMRAAMFRVLGNGCDLAALPAAGGDVIKPAGLRSRNIFEANQLADGVVVGPGNLLENGGLEVDAAALAALRKPLLVFGVSHGRILDSEGRLVERTDSLAWDRIRALAQKAESVVVRDQATLEAFDRHGVANRTLGGCPSLWLGESPLPLPPPDDEVRGAALISVRHPRLMSIPYEFQGRTYFDVRRLIDRLKSERRVFLLCHDFQDLPFARAFPDVPTLYTEDPYRFLGWLRSCDLSIGYRLHGFLAACELDTPAIHLAYDERGRSLIETVGLGEWNIDLLAVDWFDAVEDRLGTLDRLEEIKTAARPLRAELQGVQLAAIADWARAGESANIGANFGLKIWRSAA